MNRIKIFYTTHRRQRKSDFFKIVREVIRYAVLCAAVMVVSYYIAEFLIVTGLIKI